MYSVMSILYTFLSLILIAALQAAASSYWANFKGKEKVLGVFSELQFNIKESNLEFRACQV